MLRLFKAVWYSRGLKSSLAAERKTAAALLGEIGHPIAIPSLMKRLADRDSNVCHSAIASLSRFGLSSTQLINVFIKLRRVDLEMRIRISAELNDMKQTLGTDALRRLFDIIPKEIQTDVSLDDGRLSQTYHKGASHTVSFRNSDSLILQHLIDELDSTHRESHSKLLKSLISPIDFGFFNNRVVGKQEPNHADPSLQSSNIVLTEHQLLISLLIAVSKYDLNEQIDCIMTLEKNRPGVGVMALMELRKTVPDKDIAEFGGTWDYSTYSYSDPPALGTTTHWKYKKIQEAIDLLQSKGKK